MMTPCHMLPKIPRLHLNGIDVEVEDVNVARSQALRGQPTRIGTGAAVADLVATAVRRGNAALRLSTMARSAEVGDTLSDEVNDVVLALDTAANRHHAGRQDGAAAGLEHLPSCYGDRSGRNSLFISG
jgi:hypothetical protein